MYISIHLSNYLWTSAPSLCGQGVSDEAYLHRRGCHSNLIDQNDQSKDLPMNLRQPRHYLRFIAFVRLFSTSHALGGQDAFFGAICAGFLGSGFVDVVPDVFPAHSDQHALTSGAGSRTVGPHHAPAVVGLPLSAGHGVLPQHTWVLPLQQNLHGTSDKHRVSITVFWTQDTVFLANFPTHAFLIVRI